MSNYSRPVQAIFYNNPDQYPPIINSSRLLSENDYQVEILCRENGQDWSVYYPKGIGLHRIDTRSSSSWREYFGFVGAVVQRANKHAPVFIGHDMHGLLPAWLLATLFRRPLVYHCHDFADRHQTMAIGSHIVRIFEQIIARTADIVIVPDKKRAEVISQQLSLSKFPFIVSNAPIHAFSGSGISLTNALSERDQQFDRILIRQGRIGPGHAIEATLRSMPMWASRKWGFILLGWGEPTFRDRLIQLAGSLGVSDQFIILPAVGYDQLAGFTTGAHAGHALYEPIHINNMHITTASNKTMEYMAAGLPILLSDYPAEMDFVKKYRCGLVADESSPQSIAEAVNRLLGDAATAHQMGAAGRVAFDCEFCYERQYAPVMQEIGRLTGHIVKGES